VAVSAKLQREWDRKLAESGFDDIEGRASGMLRGISVQEPERAPSATELDATAEYHGRCAEFAHARQWGCQLERRIWEMHVDGHGTRAMAAAVGWAHSRAYRTLLRLQDELAAWWQASQPERDRIPRGRPRSESPRTSVVGVRLTRDERRVLAALATQHGASSVSDWIRRCVGEMSRTKVRAG
jgi:hypothetical protein